jgi:hypothetical protein
MELIVIQVHADEEFAFDGGQVYWLADDSPIIGKSLKERIHRFAKEVPKWPILDILCEVKALFEST